jgi:hypothetical protein
MNHMFPEMHHVELTVPATLNSGAMSGYVERIREELPSIGYTGWTETRATGVWHGRREPVTVFTIYVERGAAGMRAVPMIGEMARSIMTDQEAIQVVDHGRVTLFEF